MYHVGPTGVLCVFLIFFTNSCLRISALITWSYFFAEAGLKSVLYKRNSEQDFGPLVGNTDHVQKSDETPGSNPTSFTNYAPFPQIIFFYFEN